MSAQTSVTVKPYTDDVRQYEMMSLAAPESPPQAPPSLMWTDKHLLWTHIGLPCKDISSGLPVHSSHSCQMPSFHVFTLNSWQVQWMCNTLPSLEGLRSALVTKSFAGSELWACRKNSWWEWQKLSCPSATIVSWARQQNTSGYYLRNSAAPSLKWGSNYMNDKQEQAFSKTSLDK